MIRASPWAWWMVRVVGVLQSTSAARLTSGIVRLVESAVKPPRRHTKARGNPEDLAGLGTTTARGAGLGGSIFGVQWKHFDYRARS